MSQSFKKLLAALINLLLVVITAVSVNVLEKDWQAENQRVREEKQKAVYFNTLESYLSTISIFLNRIENTYDATCSRDFVLSMRKALFNIPGSIEFGVIHKENDNGVVVCSSWGEQERILVREPVAHDGFLMTGPHTLNSLDMPIYIIKKTKDDFEYNIVIKESSVDVFLENNSELSISTDESNLKNAYKKSNVLQNLTYVSLTSSGNIKSVYFIPITLFFMVIFVFFVTPRCVRLIEKTIIKRKINNHDYYNEYQAIVDTRTNTVFSIEVFLRSKDGVNALDSINKMKSLDLSVEHTLFQIKQIESCFESDFIEKNRFQVNISSVHLESKIFVDALLSFSKQIRTSLILEVTEDENLMTHKTLIRKRMKGLKEAGYRFAIDDFGIEYSSLSYVSEFDFDIVKTDKLFIEDKLKNNAILKSVISLTEDIGIECIAEGIETEADKAKVNSLGIYLHQGWHYCRSMSAEDMVRYNVSKIM